MHIGFRKGVYMVLAVYRVDVIGEQHQVYAKINTLRQSFPLLSPPELKAQVSFLSVRLSVALSVKFYIFYFLSTTTAPILFKFGTNHLTISIYSLIFLRAF
jgi:hypothetical protein